MTDRLQAMRMTPEGLSLVAVRVWYRVDVPPKRLHGRGRPRPGFVCGIETDEDGTVVTAAPIMGWAIGKDVDHVANWILFHGGTIEPLDVVALDG